MNKQKKERKGAREEGVATPENRNKNKTAAVFLMFKE